MVRCVILAFATFCQESCFGHAFDRTCQYVYNDMNVYVSFWKVNWRPHNLLCKKQLHGQKDLDKRHNEWEKANGWKSFKVYHLWWKGPNPCCSPLFNTFWSPSKLMNQKVSNIS